MSTEPTRTEFLAVDYGSAPDRQPNPARATEGASPPASAAKLLRRWSVAELIAHATVGPCMA